MIKIVVSVAICMLALIADAGPARAQVGVSVYVTNETAAKVRAVFQSTDFGDTGTECLAESSSGTSNCKASKTYDKPPKNIKNLLCISSKVRWEPTDQCKKLLAQVSGCKRNDIWTSLCKAGFGTNIVPQCIYRTGSDWFSSWSWKVLPVEKNNDRVTIDCWAENYSVLKK